ncbi:calcium load-activated calcium channel isoform X1 [Octopus sinensis]|uniref:Calcium load-activated calcium channel isoform X1 n=1 Tax=Octopus sinensis TaxID=2607531 RepID=A0A6P7TM31_9MOLL|nr:calcium load-activated calcium channel isoform X1 [Octopus sinensis]
MLVDCLLIVFISICTALLGEGLTWLMVYRTDKYKKLKSEVEKQSKKLEKQREAGMDVADRNQKKKLERQEEKLKNNSRDLSLVKMKSMFAIGFAFTALLSMFNSIFDGRVVAKLPFTPISLMQGLSHRNLAGDDYTHCSLSSSTFYVQCLYARTSKSYLVWPLQELLTNKESDSSHPHLNLLNDKLVKILKNILKINTS